MRILIVLLLISSVNVSKASFFGSIGSIFSKVGGSVTRLFDDMVTDVKQTLNCTIIAVEQMLHVEGYGGNPHNNVPDYCKYANKRPPKASKKKENQVQPNNSDVIVIKSQIDGVANDNSKLLETIRRIVDDELSKLKDSLSNNRNSKLSGYNAHSNVSDTNISIDEDWAHTWKNLMKLCATQKVRIKNKQISKVDDTLAEICEILKTTEKVETLTSQENPLLKVETLIDKEIQKNNVTSNIKNIPDHKVFRKLDNISQQNEKTLTKPNFTLNTSLQNPKNDINNANKDVKITLDKLLVNSTTIAKENETLKQPSNNNSNVIDRKVRLSSDNSSYYEIVTSSNNKHENIQDYDIIMYGSKTKSRKFKPRVHKVNTISQNNVTNSNKSSVFNKKSKTSDQKIQIVPDRFIESTENKIIQLNEKDNSTQSIQSLNSSKHEMDYMHGLKKVEITDPIPPKPKTQDADIKNSMPIVKSNITDTLLIIEQNQMLQHVNNITHQDAVKNLIPDSNKKILDDEKATVINKTNIGFNVETDQKKNIQSKNGSVTTLNLSKEAKNSQSISKAELTLTKSKIISDRSDASFSKLVNSETVNETEKLSEKPNTQTFTSKNKEKQRANVSLSESVNSEIINKTENLLEKNNTQAFTSKNRENSTQVSLDSAKLIESNKSLILANKTLPLSESVNSEIINKTENLLGKNNTQSFTSKNRENSTEVSLDSAKLIESNKSLILANKTLSLSESVNSEIINKTEKFLEKNITQAFNETNNLMTQSKGSSNQLKASSDDSRNKIDSNKSDNLVTTATLTKTMNRGKQKLIDKEETNSLILESDSKINSHFESPNKTASFTKLTIEAIQTSTNVPSHDIENEPIDELVVDPEADFLSVINKKLSQHPDGDPENDEIISELAHVFAEMVTHPKDQLKAEELSELFGVD